MACALETGDALLEGTGFEEIGFEGIGGPDIGDAVGLERNWKLEHSEP